MLKHTLQRVKSAHKFGVMGLAVCLSASMVNAQATAEKSEEKMAKKEDSMGKILQVGLTCMIMESPRW